jgi:hypothetical protein
MIATLGSWIPACVAAAWHRRAPLTAGLAVVLAVVLTAPVLVFLAALGTSWQVVR